MQQILRKLEFAFENGASPDEVKNLHKFDKLFDVAFLMMYCRYVCEGDPQDRLRCPLKIKLGQVEQFLAHSR